MVTLAEIEVFHSRPVAPTRRVALGKTDLSCDPPPGLGGLLIAGIVARFVPSIEPELQLDLPTLMRQIERGSRISQPRLRHRFQRDVIGLSKSRHVLVGEGDEVRFEFAGEGTPEQQVLGALYAITHLSPVLRTPVMDAVRRALRWEGALGPAFVAAVMGRGHTTSWSASSIADPLDWARHVLGMPGAAGVERAEIQRRFRAQLRAAHPDSGGDREMAARRIAELSEARRILLRAVN